jgi:uncharacterized membrane protein
MRRQLIGVALLLVLSPVAVRSEVFEAVNQDASYGVDKRVADPTASGGAAVECDKGVHPAPQYVFATGYYPTPPGRYRATWRLRTPDNTTTQPLVTLDLTQPGEQPYIMQAVTLKGTDFAQPNQWQDFAYDFDRLEQGEVQYRGLYLGGGDIVIDKLTVEKIGDFTEEELFAREVKQYPLEVPPDPMAVWKARRNETLEILELTGVEWQDLWRTGEAAKLLAPATFDSKVWTHIWYHNLQPGEYFPPDYATLFKYDAVLMTAGDGRRIQATGRRMLRDYVKCGGGLVVLGGYSSFGKGRDQSSWLEEIMPVSLDSPWDLAPVRNTALKGRETGVPECLLFPANWKPQALWIQQATPKPGATVAWTLDGKPALVFGRYGNGWVVAVLATNLGKPADEANLFFKTPEWPTILANTLKWVATPGWQGWH